MQFTKKQTTFGSYADSFIASKRAGWKNDKHKAQWTMTLGPTYCGSIRDKAINAVVLDDVRALLAAPFGTSDSPIRSLCKLPP